MRTTLVIVSIVCGLTACSPAADDIDHTNTAQAVATNDLSVAAVPEPVAQGDDVGNSSRSILRPEIAGTDPEVPTLEPVDGVIPFGGAGLVLDDVGRRALDKLVANPTITAGGPITLHGHSDSRGNDRANLHTSRKRAEAVRDYLVGKGISAGRITVIAMGETTPVVPNARPDGSDDPDARARNRRVDVRVELPLKQGAGGEKPDR